MSISSGKTPATGSRTIRLADKVSRWIALGIIFVATTLLVAPTLFYHPPVYSVGQVLPEDITAVVTFSVPDEVELDRQKNELTEKMWYYFKYDHTVPDQLKKESDELFAQARELALKNPNIPPSELTPKLQEWAEKEWEFTIDTKYAERILALEGSERILSSLDQIFHYMYDDRGVVDDLSKYRDSYNKDRLVVLSLPRGKAPFQPHKLLKPDTVRENLEVEYFSPRQIQFLSNRDDESLLLYLASRLARPNVYFLQDKTREALETQIADLTRNPPVKDFQKGDVLAEKGQALTRAKLDLLAQMNASYRNTMYKRIVMISIYVALLCGLVFYYIWQFRPDIEFNTRNAFLVASPVLLALILGRLALEIIKFPGEAGYLFPAGAIGMLTVILLDARSGILLVTIASLAFSVATGLDFKVFLTSLLGGYAAVAALTTVKERREVIRAGLLVGLVNAFVICMINYIDNPTDFKFRLMGWGFGNGLMCGVLALPALVLFETLFRVVTDIRLLELTGLDNPLLQLLEEKAPGTYQHSLNVAKLSEAAAKAIGANFLLVRAGAYYHDVGKILKPKYFNENQISLEEKSFHSKISPYMSATIIKNHVKAGMDLARQHHLPQRVLDFIPEHQGTTIISYPYHEALKRFENSESMDPVRESDFRYPGPRPQSIESAIVMLADVVEATVTNRFTALNVNEDELRLSVQNSISTKFNDSQFDECDLTLRDLHLIRESFVKTLLGRFHHRIAYPSSHKQSSSFGTLPRRNRF